MQKVTIKPSDNTIIIVSKDNTDAVAEIEECAEFYLLKIQPVEVGGNYEIKFFTAQIVVHNIVEMINNGKPMIAPRVQNNDKGR